VVVVGFELVEFFFESGFFGDFLHEFESHGFEILFEELIAIVFEESGAVVIGVEELVAVVEGELTVFILVERVFGGGLRISRDIGVEVTGD
jgi:hypothetical protein